MDIIVKENVKILNSVLVSGFTNTDIDEEVFIFLKQYGSFARVIEVPTTDPVTQVIAEYMSGAAVKALEENFLPYRRPCSADSQVSHFIQSLSSVYTSDAGATATDTYLSGLKNLAKLSSRQFEDILRDELARISESVAHETPLENNGHGDPEPHIEKTDINLSEHSSDAIHIEANQAPFEPLNGAKGRGFSPLRGSRISSFHLPSDQLSTPEVQRVVVEHIVKSEAASQVHSPYRLKPFSGRIPHPNFEVDYDTWRSNVQFYLNDPSISNSQMVRKIMESLSAPAANIVKCLGPHASPKEYLNLLDSAYATVEDGDELFAKFLNNNQNSGEKASDYLQRLHTALSHVVSRGGITANDSDKQLLKQFCRGCWDSTLITSLQLEQRKSNPPPFSEILLILRTEEDKQANKASRMKQHFGFTKSKAISNMQAVNLPWMDDVESVSNETDDVFLDITKDLKKQIAELQVQMATLRACSSEKPVKKKVVSAKEKCNNKDKQAENQMQQVTTRLRPRPWYCFKCGEDGHILSVCSNSPNPTLVETKKTVLREKQRAWDSQNRPATTPLN